MLALLHVAALATGAEDIRSRDETHRDLLTTIAIAGGHCGEVTETSPERPRGYRVSCTSGAVFRVLVTETEQLRVIDVTAGNVEWTPEEESHSQQVNRHLFAVITLSRHRCDQVVSVERGSDASYRVSCKNANRFVVRRTEEGRMLVQAIP